MTFIISNIFIYGGETVRHHTSNKCKMGNRPDCITPVRKHLEPVLVARIYNQPIVEEVPYSSMSMTLDNTATISSLCSHIKPICEDVLCLDGRSDIDSHQTY